MSANRKRTRWLAAAAVLLVLAAVVSAHAEIPLAERRSSYADLAPETKAMQDDDTSNPGMLAVLDGEALWKTKAGNAGRACADCHADARVSMKGVAARYPAFEPALSRPVNLEQRINICRTERQQAQPFAYESKDLLALTAFVGLQSRGLPIAPPADARLRPFLDAGRETFNRRLGQLNLSCGQCHDDNWGKRLVGNIIPQAHPNGYPLYRLEWQSIGSLQRRLRNCMIGLRAEPYEYGAPEYVSLELYLMWRARGLPVETPAVRP
ncbi:MAG: sulfur oxidation c-type cytochrome SoxA [Rhizobiales bacterium]|nr:sulfur oxidation c-type cytochrome SoxA [Hyphomicrobiales bacterium]